MHEQSSERRHDSTSQSRETTLDWISSSPNPSPKAPGSV